MQIPKLLLFIILVVVVCCLLYWSPIVLCGTSCVFNLEPINGIKKIFVTGGNNINHMNLILTYLFGPPDSDVKLHIFDGENFKNIIYNNLLTNCTLSTRCAICSDKTAEFKIDHNVLNNAYITADRAWNGDENDLKRAYYKAADNICGIDKNNQISNYRDFLVVNDTNLGNTMSYIKSKKDYDTTDTKDEYKFTQKNTDNIIYTQKKKTAADKCPHTNIMKYIEIPIADTKEWDLHSDNCVGTRNEFKEFCKTSLSMDSYVYTNKTLINNLYDLINEITSSVLNYNLSDLLYIKTGGSPPSLGMRNYLHNIPIKVGSDMYNLLNPLKDNIMADIPTKSLDDFFINPTNSMNDKKNDIDNAYIVINDDPVLNINNIKNVNFRKPYTYVSLRTALFYYIILRVMLTDKLGDSIETYLNYTNIITNFNNFTINMNSIFEKISKLLKVRGTIGVIPHYCYFKYISCAETSGRIQLVYNIPATNVKTNIITIDITDITDPDIPGNYTFDMTDINELHDQLNIRIKNVSLSRITMIECISPRINTIGMSNIFYTVAVNNMSYDTRRNDRILTMFTHILAGYDDFVLLYIKSIYGHKCDIYTLDGYSDFLSYTLLNRPVIYKNSTYDGINKTIYSIRGSYFEFEDEIKDVNFTGIPNTVELYQYNNYNNYIGTVTRYSDIKKIKTTRGSVPVTKDFDETILTRFDPLNDRYYDKPRRLNGLYINRNRRNNNELSMLLFYGCIVQGFIDKSNYDSITRDLKLLNYRYGLRRDDTVYNILLLRENYTQPNTGTYNTDMDLVGITDNASSTSEYLYNYRGINGTDVVGNNRMKKMLTAPSLYDGYYRRVVPNRYLFMGFPDINYRIYNNKLNKPKNITLSFEMYNSIRDKMYNDITNNNDWNTFKYNYPQLIKNKTNNSFDIPNYQIR